MAIEFFIFFIPSFILFNLVQLYAFRNLRALNNGNYIMLPSKRGVTIMKLVLFEFCVFGAFGGDWFHYRIEISRFILFAKIPEQRHLEDVYVWIIDNITKQNYILFRLIIWSASVFMLSKGIKRLKMDNVVTWSCFMLLSAAVSYAIGRGSLGFSLIIWGYSYLLMPGKHKILSYSKALVLLSLSLFCHKSMFLMAPLTLLSFINFNIKRTILVAIFILFILGIFQKYVLIQLASTDSSTGQEYFEESQESFGIGYNLWLWSYYFIMYAFIIYAYYKIVIKRNVPIHIKRIYNFVLLILFEYFAIYFAFTFQGIGNNDLSWRIFAMINIPLPLVVSYLLTQKFSQFIMYVYVFAFVIANYFILYNAYTNYF